MNLLNLIISLTYFKKYFFRNRWKSVTRHLQDKIDMYFIFGLSHNYNIISDHLNIFKNVDGAFFCRYVWFGVDWLLVSGCRDSEDGVAQHPKHPFVTIGLPRQCRLHLRLRCRRRGRLCSSRRRRRVRCWRRLVGSLRLCCNRRHRLNRFGPLRNRFSVTGFSGGGVVLARRTKSISALVDVVPSQCSRRHFWRRHLMQHQCSYVTNKNILIYLQIKFLE